MNPRPSIRHILLFLILAFVSALPARAWYDTGQGRWCSRDPIGENGGENLYGFLGNNGISGVDVAGLYPTVEEAIREGYTEAATHSLRDWEPGGVAGYFKNREWCGIVCKTCDKDTGKVDYFPTKAHPGLWSVPVLENGNWTTGLFKERDKDGYMKGRVQIDGKNRGGSCSPSTLVDDTPVICPKGSFAGTFHSHPISLTAPGSATPSQDDIDSGVAHGKPWGIGEVGKGSDGKASIINGKIVYPKPPAIDVPIIVPGGIGTIRINLPKNLIVPQSPIPVPPKN